MKKIVAVLLALIMCFALSACGETTNKNLAGNGIDLAAALENGKIPEIDITLGMKAEDVNVSEEHSHEDNSDDGYSFVEGNKYSYFLNQSAFAYYKNSKKSNILEKILKKSKYF